MVSLRRDIRFVIIARINSIEMSDCRAFSPFENLPGCQAWDTAFRKPEHSKWRGEWKDYTRWTFPGSKKNLMWPPQGRGGVWFLVPFGHPVSWNLELRPLGFFPGFKFHPRSPNRSEHTASFSLNCQPSPPPNPRRLAGRRRLTFQFQTRQVSVSKKKIRHDPGYFWNGKNLISWKSFAKMTILIIFVYFFFSSEKRIECQGNVQEKKRLWINNLTK